MWTESQVELILSKARDAKPQIVTYAIPYGLQVQKGPDAIVEHLCEHIPILLDTVTS